MFIRLSFLIIFLVLNTCLFASSSSPKSSNTDSKIENKNETLLFDMGVIDIQSGADLAFFSANQIKDKQEKCEKLIAVSRLYVKEKNIKAALSIADRLSRYKQDQTALHVILGIVYELSLEKAFDQILPIVSGLKTYRKQYIIENLALFQIEMNEFSILDDLLKQASPIVQARLFQALARHKASHHQLVDALSYLIKLNSSLQAHEFLFIFNQLDYKEQAEWLEIIPESLKSSDDYLYAKASFSVRSEDISSAIAFIKLFKNNHYQDQLYALIASHFLEKKDMDNAISFANQISSISIKEPVLSEIVIKMTPFKSFDSIMAIVQEFTLPDIKSQTMTELMYKLLEIKNYELAFELFHSIQLDVEKEVVLMKFANMMANHKDYLYPLLFLEKIEPDHLRLKVKSAFAIAFFKKGMKDKALSVIELIKDKKTVYDTLLGIAPYIDINDPSLVEFASVLDKDDQVDFFVYIPYTQKPSSVFLTLLSKLDTNRAESKVSLYFLRMIYGQQPYSKDFVSQVSFIPNSSKKDRLIQKFIQILLETKQTEEALDLVFAIQDISYRTESILMIVSENPHLKTTHLLDRLKK